MKIETISGMKLNPSLFVVIVFLVLAGCYSSWDRGLAPDPGVADGEVDGESDTATGTDVVVVDVPGVCGNGVMEIGEGCDDGNDEVWDGCDACQVVEFRVNSFTSWDQTNPAVDMAADGTIAMVWQSWEQDGSGQGVFARIWDRGGRARGEDILVNASMMTSQQNADIAIAPDGKFVVVWESWYHNGVFGRCFRADGVPIDWEFRVNVHTTEDKQFAKVAMADDGSFVVVWEAWGQDGDGPGIYGRAYEPDCTPGEVFQVNTYTVQDQAVPAIAMAPDGRYVVVWQSWGQDGDSFGIFGQRYAPGSVAECCEFQVNAVGAGSQLAPDVAIAPDGTFLPVWASYGGTGGPARLFSVEGSPFAETAASGLTVAMSPDLAWVSVGQSRRETEHWDLTAIVGGVSGSTTMPVSVYTESDQEAPDSAMTPDGRFVIVWESDGQDGDGRGIFAQRYGGSGNPIGTLPW